MVLPPYAPLLWSRTSRSVASGWCAFTTSSIARRSARNFASSPRGSSPPARACSCAMSTTPSYAARLRARRSRRWSRYIERCGRRGRFGAIRAARDPDRQSVSHARDVASASLQTAQTHESRARSRSSGTSARMRARTSSGRLGKSGAGSGSAAAEAAATGDAIRCDDATRRRVLKSFFIARQRLSASASV
eukprot:29191-Pelagococcus_subviridis.AAC.1